MRAAFNISGAVDEDHRQLRILQNEAEQLLVSVNSLGGQVNNDAARQQEYLISAQNQLSQLNEAVDGIRIYGETPGKSPIVSFTVDGTHPADIGMIVDKLGVAVRTGTHCAEPVMTHYGLTAMCRLSIGLYNTEEEIETAVAAIRRAADMLR